MARTHHLTSLPLLPSHPIWLSLPPFPTQIAHNDPILTACTNHLDAHTGPCILYIGVKSEQTDARFTLTCTAHDVTDGFRVTAPKSIAGAYPFIVSAFGPRLPRAGINACVRYTEPHDACRHVTNDLNGTIALLDRGSTIPIHQPGFCDYPDVLFADKIVRAQEAGAIGVIVVNNIPHTGLVNMVATSGDESRRVTVPAVFVSYEVGAVIKQQLLNTSLGDCVRASLSRPRGRLPMLVDGVPTRGLLSDPQTTGNAVAYYQFLTPAAHDNVTISLTAEFGNPDVFVSSDGRAPNQQQYTWASRDVGSDTLVIDAHDPRACEVCPYIIAVIATSGDVGYTLMASVQESLRTLQTSVPLGNQEVSANGYAYYRFFVDRNLYGVTLSVVPTSGTGNQAALCKHLRRPLSLAHPHPPPLSLRVQSSSTPRSRTSGRLPIQTAGTTGPPHVRTPTSSPTARPR